MRFLLGTATFAAVGAGIALWMAPGPDAELAVVTEISKGGVATLSVPSAGSDRPAAGDAGASPRFFGTALTRSASEAPAVAPAPLVPEAATAASIPKGSWGADVVVYPETQISEVASLAPSPVVMKVPAPVAAQPRRDNPRAELVRDLHRELRRVGCYTGDVSGDWGAASKRSLRAFLDHVGSRGQSEEPDLTKFTLVRGYYGVACRPANGQMTASRQQVPLAPPPSSGPATIAQSPQVATGPVEQPQVPAARAAPLDGRMAVGGPVADGAGVDPAAPPLAAPPPKPFRPAAPRQPRQDRAWMNNFFNN